MKNDCLNNTNNIILMLQSYPGVNPIKEIRHLKDKFSLKFLNGALPQFKL